MTIVRPLPRRVAAVDGETSTSYLNRLAVANAMSPATLWSHLRSADPSLPHKPAPDKSTILLEQLGGLDPGWFAADRRRHLLPSRCPHHSWRYTAACPICGRLPAVQSGCRRCSLGKPTQVRGIGPICLRHEVWHFDDRDIAVSTAPEYVHAERALRSRLFPLGVAAQTGELQLASRLLTTWIRHQPYAAIGGRRQVIRADEFDPADAFWVFPEAVALTETLTDPGFTSYLLSPSWSASLQTELLIAATTGIVNEAPPAELTALAARIVEHGNSGVRIAYGLTGSRARRRGVSFERALAAAARSHRACLLRHLDTSRLPAGSLDDQHGTPYVSSARVIATSDRLPDLDHRELLESARFTNVREHWSDNPLVQFRRANPPPEPRSRPRRATPRSPGAATEQPRMVTATRAGQRWTEGELARLVEEIRSGRSPMELARSHERTRSSIDSAVVRLLPYVLRPTNHRRAVERLAQYLREHGDLTTGAVVSSYSYC